MEVLRDFAQSEPLNPPTRSPTIEPGAFEPAAAASTRRVLLGGLSPSKPLPPLTVRLLHGRLLRLDLIADLSHLLLRALSFSGLHLHALSLHSLFPDPSDLTLPFALNSASRLPNPLPVGEQLHARSLKLPSHSNPHVLTSLLSLYGKCGLLNHARGVFDEMRCPSTVSWTALIAAYMNAGRDREAVATARDAFASGMRLNSFTAVRVLTACARAADLDTGEVAWRAAQREGIAGDVFVATAAVDLYVRCGEMAKAREVFDKMPEKDAVSWGAMVWGYASNKNPREALELFFAMQTQGVRPDCCTVADALSVCTWLGELDLGRQAARVVDLDEFLENPFLGTALIDMYVKCGSTWDAWFVFQQMRKKDIVVWNKMILRLGMTGHGKTVFALVGQMEKTGMKLNANTFIGVLCSCTHAGLVEDGRRYFRNMIQLYHITLQIEHYGCMVNLFSRAGLLQEAHQLIGDMPMQANVVMWRALLGGCEIHRDTELAEHVLKQLILLEPLNSENYVMLLNIYSNSDRWEDAAKLRLDMKAKGVEKFRGQPTAWPLLQEVLVRADEEHVRAAGREPVLRTRVRRDSSGVRQVVPVCAKRAGAGGVENWYVFKSRLQDYAQKAGLMTPVYQTLKEGPSHEPIFKSTVVINNAKYESLPGFFNWNAAEQSAAEVALMEIGKFVVLPTNEENWRVYKSRLHEYTRKAGLMTPEYHTLTEVPSHEPIFKSTVVINNVKYESLPGFFSWNAAEQSAAEFALMEIGKSVALPTNASISAVEENWCVYKSRLHEYTQKAGLMKPEYHTLKEEPSHEPIFKSTVVINNAKYESMPGSFSWKATEQSAAKVALMDIGKSVALPTNASIPAVQETGLCKSLLQRYAQKMNYTLPSYICNKASRVAHFICTVEIGGIQYIGAAARTKKEAEIKAAGTALLAIQGKSEVCANGTTKYIVVPGKRQGKETEKKSIETPELLKAKKCGLKKQRNKTKFIKKNGIGGEHGQLLRRGVGRFVRAYSWVEFSGKVHEFRVGDKSHPLMCQIYKKLDELGMEMKSMGYKPSTDVVLFDLEDEKEHTLVPYSEKLAIAFGLLSTRPGEAIRVTNNLRVCTDCHTAIKLISRIAHREIIVQDNSRLHCFRDGCCSCNDHW